MPDERTILFADVSGSTHIIETVGDVEGRAFVARILDELARITDLYHGEVVKTIGDEVMSSFAAPLDAVAAAVEMQRVVQALEPMGDVKPKIKVGLHGGPVILEGGDIFGDVVNVAARVVSMAEGNQILTTAVTLEAAGDTAVPNRSLGEHAIRGKNERLQLREVLWEDNPELLTALAPPRRVVAKTQLEVRLGDAVLSMSGRTGVVKSLGRGESNSLVVADDSASRAHADISARAGRFYLADHSTNGTYVRSVGGDAMFVHRDEVLLGGAGAIRLGRAFTDPEGPTLEYRVT